MKQLIKTKPQTSLPNMYEKCKIIHVYNEHNCYKHHVTLTLGPYQLILIASQERSKYCEICYQTLHLTFNVVNVVVHHEVQEIEAS